MTRRGVIFHRFLLVSFFMSFFACVNICPSVMVLGSDCVRVYLRVGREGCTCGRLRRYEGDWCA